MKFPLTFRFKLFALAPQIFVTDSGGTQLFYVKQKLFKLRDAINIFSDQNQTQQVASINSDRVIDFSAKFNITGPAGEPIGAIGRKGLASLWRAHYEVFDAAGQQVGNIKEESVAARLIDTMLGEIPFLGILALYVLQPKYLLTDMAGAPILRLKKKPSWVDRRFELEQVAQTVEADDYRNVLSYLMLVLLERNRK